MVAAEPESNIVAAGQAIRSGGVVAYPTEGVWGLGCDPFNEAAVERLLTIKQRPSSKGLILISSDISYLQSRLMGLSASQWALLAASRGTFTTWLVPHGGGIPDWISGGGERVAVRLTDHRVVEALCRAFDGLLVSTSANPAGLPAATTEAEVRAYFGDLIDVIVPGALGGENGASEIRDMVTGHVIRPRGS
jgi:L-threonylcarbamoyladenylate synthase